MEIHRKEKIEYKTRDGDGNDIVKEVKIKKFEEEPAEILCPICHEKSDFRVLVKKVVSSDFTDWQYVGEHICPSCADLFSLHFYSYIVDANGIRLLNVRRIRDQLLIPQTPPFLFVITKSQKKHLFYKSIWNNRDNPFAVNLETETIYTTRERMKQLFDFVESLQSLGCSKERMKLGAIPYEVLKKVGVRSYDFLQKELNTSREIQIPLHCGQKRNISEEEAICCLNSILMI